MTELVKQVQVSSAPLLVPSWAPVLRQVAALVPLDRIDELVMPHIYPMKALMRAHQAVGIAAPQVGISLRFFLMQMDGAARIVINPRIARRWGQVARLEEGCISFPGFKGMTLRHMHILVEWNTSAGERRKLELQGRNAQIFQHEFDHLDGTLIFP